MLILFVDAAAFVTRIMLYGVRGGVMITFCAVDSTTEAMLFHLVCL